MGLLLAMAIAAVRLRVHMRGRHLLGWLEYWTYVTHNRLQIVGRA